MTYIITTAVRKLAKLNKRIHGVAGGTSASKTISILQVLIDKAQRDETPTITSIVSESMPHLRKGAMRDFISIMRDAGYFVDERWNKTDFIYTFETGSIFEFFSVDSPYKTRGPRRQRLFINEANNVPFESFEQLEIRTEYEIWLDWNPVSAFWFYENEEGMPGVVGRDDVDFTILTYRDNEGLPDSIRNTIEARRNNANWWRVYGEGLLGESEDRIYTGWEVIDSVPHEARLERYGLDFGYTNDPTAIDAIYKWNGGILIDEILHQTGLSNKQIADVLKNVEKSLVISDSAEPKSIDEIYGYGINIKPAQKGKDSILHGIQTVQSQKIFITKRSINTLKEYRNYLWLRDKNGRITNEPSPIWNHHMDAIRYALESLTNNPVWKPNNPGGVKPFFPGIPG